MRTYNQKTVISGNVVEQTTYQRSNTHGRKLTPGEWGRRWTANNKRYLRKIKNWDDIETTLESRKLSMFRAKKNLTCIINTNIYQYKDSYGRYYPPVFLTLTFKEDIRKQKEANKIFTLFIKKLNYEITKEKTNILKYSVVIEFQDKTREGVIHYHAILYNLPFIRKEKLEKLWGKGFLNVKKIDNVKNIARYITKYMAKNFEDTRLDKHKRYFSSRGLIKPNVYIGEFAYQKIREAMPQNAEKWEIEFETKYKGKILKTIFTIPRKDNLVTFIDQNTLQEIKKYEIS